MTANEFNIKYKDYLEEGHYGLGFDYPRITNYLDEMFQELIKIPGFQYSQIKWKFSSSCFYTNLNEVLGVKLGSIITYEIEKKINFYVSIEDEIRKRLQL